MTATLKPQFIEAKAPLLNLPFEILQQIASYLNDTSAARFSLSGRQICYAIGTQRLSTYIASSPSRFSARERLENTIERALPGAWHCAWCDKFHPWSASDGPSAKTQGPQSPCADYNSYLSDGMGYTLRYHHIRLALAHHHRGAIHGLPLSSFDHSTHGTITLFRTPVQTSISHSAKITDGVFLLHTSYALLLPSWAAAHKNLIGHLWPLLPAILTQHRATEHGHSGLMAAIDNVARRGWRVLGAQTCAACASDWSVAAFPLPRSIAGEFVRLDVRVWRDLGAGLTPFDGAWRAHGVFLAGAEDAWARGDVEAQRERGAVRDAFERAEGEGGFAECGARGQRVECGAEARKKGDEEREWRAVWRYIERRAGVVGVKG